MKKSLNKNKKINILTKRNIIILIVLVLLIPLTVYGYNKWLDYNDQQRFMKVKADVEEIQRRLEAAAPEVTWKLEPTCRRAHLTFGDGDASCEILVSGEKDITNKQKALSLSDRLDGVFASTTDLLFLRRKGTETPKGFMDRLDEGTVGNGYNNISTGMPCSTLKEILLKDSSPIFVFTFSCVDDSRDAWFPRSDK
jgi:hypothetical protein